MSTSEDEISYREFVQRHVKTTELSPDDHDALENYRTYLRLLPAKARAIEQEVLRSQGASPRLASSSPALTSTVDLLAAPVSASKVESAKFQPAQSDLAQSSAETATVLSRRLSDSDQKMAGSQSSLNSLPLTPNPQPEPVAPEVKSAASTTIIPPQLPERYLAHRQQYGQEFLQALRSEGFNLGDETRERLRKLAHQLELLSSDVADIERTMLVEVYLTNQPLVEAQTTAAPPPIEEKYDPGLRPLFEELEGSLKAKELKLADMTTCEILLKVIRPSEDWLDETSLRSFSTPSAQNKNAIQEIDRLWEQYSDGKFGFGQQLQLYSFGAVPSNDKDLDKDRREHRILALAFSRSAQWWIDGLEFFKYYNQLDFTFEAPRGHLPAWWFWKIPRQKAFQYGGLGLLRERGGCRVDAYILPAFMCVLKKSGIKPR